MLPLDLHVLSLSLAFILSQDQTLRCYCLYLCSEFLFSSLLLTVLLRIFQFYVSCTTCWYVNIFKELFRYRFDCGCKGKDFFLTTKFFEKNFWSFFQSSSETRTHRLVLLTLSLSPDDYLFIMLSCRSLSNAGAKLVL